MNHTQIYAIRLCIEGMSVAEMQDILMNAKSEADIKKKIYAYDAYDLLKAAIEEEMARRES